MNTKISIISANYNKGAFVKECVKSVCNQTDPNWEYIFIDDGSDDGSFEMASEAAQGDERCLFLKNTTGIKGANAARNMAIERAKGEFILFLDSDDILTPNAVKDRLADFAKFPDMDMLIYPMGLFMDEIGDSNLISNIPTKEDDLDRFLDRDIAWSISGPTWKKSALSSLRGFNPVLQSQQDVDIHTRALIKDMDYKYFHQTPNVYYRRNVESVARETSQSMSHLRSRFEMIIRYFEMLEKEQKLNPLRKILLARGILDLAQMMRWHIQELGRDAPREALKIWEKAKILNLVDDGNYKTGRKYIRFKHTMIYNRFPQWQKKIEAKFRRKLDGYIFYPHTTHCRSTLADYEA